jgi:hypothetical protein
MMLCNTRKTKDGKAKNIKGNGKMYVQNVRRGERMHKGDKVTVNYIYSERRKEQRKGTVEYISPFGWVAIRFGKYLEGFWRDEVSKGC